MRRIIILGILLLFMMGCNNKSAGEPELEYTKAIQNEPQKDSADSSEKLPEPTLTVNNDALSDFHGINSDVQSPACGNLPINIKTNSISCLVCPDPERNAVYYTNLGKDNYIYELKDGESRLLLDKKTKFIQLWEGELYFLGFNEIDGLHNNIYKYNLATKQIETVIEAEVTWMHINENGIYFIRENGGKYESCRLLFDSTEIEQIQWDYFLQYKDYFIVLEKKDNDQPSVIKLIKENSGECILEIPNVRKSMSVYQDYLCYIGYTDDLKNLILNVINLKTGERKVYGSDYGNLAIKLNVSGYTIIDNKIIYTLAKDVFIKNIEDGSIEMRHVKTNAVCSYIEIYTDGSNLFAKREILDTKKRSLSYDIVELVMGENEITERELGQ